MIFDLKPNKQKLGVLELLKTPNSDINIKIIYDELGIKFKSIYNNDDNNVLNMTLLD